MIAGDLSDLGLTTGVVAQDVVPRGSSCIPIALGRPLLIPPHSWLAGSFTRVHSTL